MENEAGNRPGVEAVFSKTLTNLPSVQLWSTYLDHIRRYYNVAKDPSPQAGQINHAAYNAVLDAIGIDKDAGQIWQDFITFIKSGPGTVGGTSWQDQQKMDELRKAYTRAICIPNQSVEAIWKEYSSFEMGLNKLTVRAKVKNFRHPGLIESREESSCKRNPLRICQRVHPTLSSRTSLGI
jgi:cleavage stimulation factor subunit 3